LFTTAIPIIGTAEESKNKTINDRSIITVNNYNGDFLDQQQNSTCNWGWNIHKNQWVAQGFIPSVNILTRVQLYLFKAGNPPEDAEIVFSIKENLTGADLTSITLKSDKLPTGTESKWVEFDFEDINVTPNYLYYMVCKGTTGDAKNCYCWLYNYINPYENGEAWLTYDYGQTWIKA